MGYLRTCVAALVAAGTFLTGNAARAADASQAEIEQLRRDIEDLRKKLSSSQAPVRSSVDKALDNKFGPNAAVTTKTGKLTISGLIQVWYYSIENDNDALFEDNTINDINDTGEAIDNDSFRVRRSELKFSMDVHENIEAVIMIDPAREATSFPGFPNTAITKRTTNVNLDAVRSGAGAVPRLLQDAYIRYHGVIPHHEFQIGQFKPAFGEEGIRSAAQLDFVERSFVGLIGDARDIGFQMRGTWWDDRFQYWGGIFNSPGNYHGSGGQQQNRSDDNDEKDFVGRVLIRPLWNSCRWGSLEMGYSVQAGIHGESGGRLVADGDAVNGLNRRETNAIRHAAWGMYRAGSYFKGMWIRGEWASIKDRHAPNSVFDPLGRGSEDLENLQVQGAPFKASGWYAAAGYHVGDSYFADCAPSWLKGLEFVLRYQEFQNVQIADPANERHTNLYKTDVWTAGFNYYIKKHNAKIQVNYNIVDDPDEDDKAEVFQFDEHQNDSLVVNFQVAF